MYIEKNSKYYYPDIAFAIILETFLCMYIKDRKWKY